jgi:hypothetical protein
MSDEKQPKVYPPMSKFGRVALASAAALTIGAIGAGAGACAFEVYNHSSHCYEESQECSNVYFDNDGYMQCRGAPPWPRTVCYDEGSRMTGSTERRGLLYSSGGGAVLGLSVIGGLLALGRKLEKQEKGDKKPENLDDIADK